LWHALICHFFTAQPNAIAVPPLQMHRRGVLFATCLLSGHWQSGYPPSLGKTQSRLFHCCRSCSSLTSGMRQTCERVVFIISVRRYLFRQWTDTFSFLTDDFESPFSYPQVLLLTICSIEYFKSLLACDIHLKFFLYSISARKMSFISTIDLRLRFFSTASSDCADLILSPKPPLS
uniref:Secreted protein n=1 Tax=Hydatigena taeniaeformis TaxID=6205 RepID=A0A0R3WWE5_HYDTA